MGSIDAVPSVIGALVVPIAPGEIAQAIVPRLAVQVSRLLSGGRRADESQQHRAVHVQLHRPATTCNKKVALWLLHRSEHTT